MMTVIANLKGGSGKSTIAFNLAVWLATRGIDVVALDLDPQATLSDVLEVRQEEGYEPSIALEHVESHIAEVLSRHGGQEILVDVGASNIPAMREAIAHSQRILIPVGPSQADIWATQRFLFIVEEAVPPGRRVERLGFINRADTHYGVRESDEAEEALSLLPGLRPLGVRLYQRTVYRRSLSEGLAVFELEPGGKAAEEFERFARLLYPDGHP
ncbi:MAG: ParA family protein [Gammaproteobacteria bacterium]|nr:MAG: ParA family protein [Gammaproteobacteria bacterium]